MSSIDVSTSSATMQSGSISQMQPPASASNSLTGDASNSSKLLHSGQDHEAEDSFEHTTSDGKTIRIMNSGIVHTLSHKKCLQAGTSLGLIATLFYNTHKTSINPNADFSKVREDVNYGAHVSDMAVFEFIQTIDEVMVPWKKGSPPHHNCLDSAPKPKIMEIALAKPENLQIPELRRHENLRAFEKKWNIDVVLQENDVWRRYKRLVVFDMDSTLIQQEVIDEIARYVGVEDQVSAITALAMDGQIDFTESLKQRVALLKGVPATVFESLKSIITFTPGARELTRALKRLGCKMAVLSGGFVPLANYVKEELGLDYAHANTLVVSEDGTLTGEITGDIVHAERKAELLEKIAAENGISLQQVVAIGDGANDLKMMSKAGLGIAFNAKPHVQREAPCRLNSESLQDVLYILGFKREEQEKMLEA